MYVYAHECEYLGLYMHMYIYAYECVRMYAHVCMYTHMLYSDKDLNNNSNTITGSTNEFISFYHQSLKTRGERHKS